MDRSLAVGHYFRFFYRYSKLMVAIADDDLRLRIGWSATVPQPNVAPNIEC